MKKILFFIILPTLGLAQNSLVAKVQLGYSYPIALWRSYVFAAYETGGKMSNAVSLSFERKKHLHTFRVQSGLTILGFNARFFEGVSSNSNFPNVESGIPVLLQRKYTMGYLDNSVGYGIDVKSKTHFNLSVHYLWNTISRLEEEYKLTQGFDVIYQENRYINLRKQGISFYNHIAVSAGMRYKLAQNTYIGCHYLIGLMEFNPFVLDMRIYSRLNQNFSLTLEYRLWNNKKQNKKQRKKPTDFAQNSKTFSVKL